MNKQGDKNEKLINNEATSFNVKNGIPRALTVSEEVWKWGEDLKTIYRHLSVAYVWSLVIYGTVVLAESGPIDITRGVQFFFLGFLGYQLFQTVRRVKKANNNDVNDVREHNRSFELAKMYGEIAKIYAVLYSVGFVVLGPEIYANRNGDVVDRVIGVCRLLALFSLIWQSVKMSGAANAIKSHLPINSPLQQRSQDLEMIYNQLGCIFMWIFVLAMSTTGRKGLALMKDKTSGGLEWFNIIVGGCRILAAFGVMWQAAKLFKAARQF